ncbi:IclR family transcriptional regulator [Rhodobacter sp. NTK016B]|uniref:IclR family transcriptional regulator n=1 Tax=Rhodobacter sp. NTK016B TaxID=2759676 RepID=UPI001A900861|nr:IclR family transcriptional regulator [Rhodobacter sp. NTK016B]MBN8291781.1 IclR family transcriptional regulator [Rhodobacter sp. NTK016B]
MIKSVEKAFRVLEGLSRADGPMRLSDIARANGITRSNAFHLLQTLQELDYVRQAEDSTLYEATFRSFEMGARLLARNTLVAVAHPFLLRLSEQVPENVMLNVRDGLWNVVADRIESRSVVRTLAYLGARAPLQSVSSGKVLLAHAPASVIDEVARSLVAYTMRSITDPDALRAQLAQIREQGYAVAIGEVNEDAKGVASPVRDRHGDVVAALSIAGPMNRLGEDTIARYVALQHDTIRQIEAAWANGWRGGVAPPQFPGQASVARPSSA